MALTCVLEVAGALGFRRLPFCGPVAAEEGLLLGPWWKTLVMRPLVIVLGALAVVGLVWFVVRRAAA
jgi:hypothetical protein